MAADPSTVSIGSVVRLTEPDFTMVECFDEQRNTCSLSPTCALRNVLGRATKAYLQELDQVSLASVLARPHAAAMLRHGT